MMPAHNRSAGSAGFIGHSVPSIEDVRGAVRFTLAYLREEAKNLVRGPEYLTQIIDTFGKDRIHVALGTAARIAEMRLTSEELASVFRAEIDTRERLAGVEPSPEIAATRWEALGSVLADAWPAEAAGESAYLEAEEIIFAEDTRRARLATLPRGMSCGELLATDFPPPQWIVPELLVSGLTILAGAPKLGKSWLALALGSAVGSGGAVLGRYRVERRGAVYLALEDTPRRLKDRLAKIGAARDALLELFTQWRSGTDGIADLEAYLSEKQQVKLVLIDTLARFRGAPQGDDRYSEDYRAAAAIKTIADQHDCAIVLIHHVRKMAAEDIMDTVSGSNGLNGAADSTWILTRARGEADASLFITGRDVEEQSLALRFDSTCGTWAVLGDAEDYAQTNERRAILRELEGGREAKSGELAKALGKSPQAVSNRLRDLEREGLIHSPRYGVWALIGRVSSETVKVPKETLANIEDAKQGTFTGLNEAVKVSEVAEVTKPELTHLHDLHGVIDPPQIAEPAPDATFPKAGKRKKGGEAVGVSWEVLGAEEAEE